MSTVPTLYEEMRAAGCEIDHHETDLYVKDTPEARAVLEAYKVTGYGPVTVSAFRSEVDGAMWLDIPFYYAPAWPNWAGGVK